MSIKYNISFVDNKKLVLNTNKYYMRNFFDKTNQINLSAVIGENGSGKSSLLKLIMLLLYNNFNREHSSTLKDCFLIVEINDKFYKIGADNQELSLHVNNNDMVFQKYTSKFYTLYFNYMLDSLKDNSEENWIDEIYHKSNNYTVPILLEPYKKHNNIDINNLNYLTRQRMISNKKHISQNAFLQKIFSPDRVNLSIDINKIINIFKRTIEGEEAYRFIHKEYSSELLPINNILNNISDMEKTILDYRKEINLINSRLSSDIYEELLEKDIKELNNNKNSLEQQLVKDEETMTNLKQTLKDNLYDIELYVLNNLYIANKVDRLKKLAKKNGSLELGDLVFSGKSGSAHKLKIENNDKSHTTLKLRNAMKFYDFCLTHNLVFKPYERVVSIKEEFLDFLPGWFEVEFIDEKDRTFTSLSAGEKSFYILLTTLIYQIDNIVGRQKLSDGNYNNILILLDEADLGLHPKWQRNYLYNIVETLKQFSSNLSFHVICTSHSPFIVSDLPKDNILFLNDGKVDTLKDNEYTFGENIHTLLNDSFFMQKDMMMGKISENKIKDTFDFFEEVFDNNKQIERMKMNIEELNNFEDKPEKKINEIKKSEKEQIQNKLKKLTFKQKKLKTKYEEQYQYFANLRDIIGEEYIKMALTNGLEECNEFFNISNEFSNNENKILQALKNNPSLANKWIRDIK